MIRRHKGRPRSISRPWSRTGENPPYGILGRAMETSASFEARSAPSSHPTQITISSPERLRPMLQTKQAQPFNFLLSAQVASLLGHPEGVDQNKFHLVAPYE